MTAFSSVRDYFEGIAGELGYRKHYDGFATDNIPGTTYNKTYHVEAFEFNQDSSGQNALTVNCPVIVKLYFKAYRDVDAGIESATIAGEGYVESVLDSTNALQETYIRQVKFNSMSVDPYAGSNDNYIVCNINLNAILFKGIC